MNTKNTIPAASQPEACPSGQNAAGSACATVEVAIASLLEKGSLARLSPRMRGVVEKSVHELSRITKAGKLEDLRARGGILYVGMTPTTEDLLVKADGWGENPHLQILIWKSGTCLVCKGKFRTGFLSCDCLTQKSPTTSRVTRARWQEFEQEIQKIRSRVVASQERENLHPHRHATYAGRPHWSEPELHRPGTEITPGGIMFDKTQ